MSGFIPRRLAGLLAAACLAALASLAPPPLNPSAPSACAAAGSHHVAVVAEHGNGSTVTACVAFAPTAITGEQALNASGISWSGQTFSGFGAAVCAVDGEPAHYVDCPGKDSYWAVFVARSGRSWTLASVGISSLSLHDGDALGLRYVPTAGTPLAPVSPRGVCPLATQPPKPSAVAPATAASSAAPSAATVEPSPTASTPTPSPANLASPWTSPSASPSVASSPPSSSSGPGGPDLGLLLAAVGGGALVGLVMLRFVAMKRGAP